ncbi:MAG: hypothetical protein MUO62_19600, partial [Anaerolineales bacterium]|nr:hypothetical protein [Anaerolineales bacterium]
RTMALLTLLGALDKYQNFSQKLSFRDYVRWGLLTEMSLTQTPDIRRKAWEAGRYGMAAQIQLAIVLRKIKKPLVETIKKMLTKEQLWSLKRRIYRTDASTIGSKHDHSPT